METLYGVAMESEFYEHLKAEFTALKQTIVAELGDGLDLSDIPPIVSQFVRSGVTIVGELQAAGPDKEAILLGALMEFYDQEVEPRISFPYADQTKPMIRSNVQGVAKALIAIVVPLFESKPMAGAEDPAASVERLGFFQRRQLGLTLINVSRKNLKDSGEIRDGMDNATMALAVANALIAEEPEAYKAAAGRDWSTFFESLIAFLEKFIPLLITILF